jgi:hypothetical protein
MEYKIQKVNKLTPKDIVILTSYIDHNFNKIATFDELFPEKVMYSKTTKTTYFRHVLEDKKDVSLEFIDNYYKTKYKNAFLSKERVLTDLLDTIEKAKWAGEYSSVISGYKLLSELLGLRILKGQIDVNQTSLILHYHSPIVQPALSNDQITIDIKMNEIDSGDKLQTTD